MTEMSPDPGYNFAYLDEDTKRMIRRARLKAVAIRAVVYSGREIKVCTDGASSSAHDAAKAAE